MNCPHCEQPINLGASDDFWEPYATVRPTAREREILRALLSTFPDYCSMEALTTGLFGMNTTPERTSVRTYVQRLRFKIKPDVARIDSIHGIGYQLVLVDASL